MLEKMKNINFYLYQILFKRVHIPVLSYYHIYADTECHLFRPKRASGAKQKASAAKQKASGLRAVGSIQKRSRRITAPGPRNN